MKLNFKPFLLIISETLGLSACMLLSVFPLSCKVSVSGLEVIGTDCKVPVLEKYEILDEKSLSMTFSDEVNLLSAGVTECDTEDPKNLKTEHSKSEDGKTIYVNIPDGTTIGKNYIFTGEVENNTGSSLTFSYRFTGYNGNIPKLVLSEIMDETRRYSKNKIEHKIFEFIEFYALTDGNLSGLKLISANDGESKAFEFPNIYVQAGDFITVHYRKNSLDGDLCISEISGDKTLCTAEGSSDLAWDLYVENTEARLGASQDVIILENTCNGKILQAIMYSKNGKTEWAKEEFKNLHDRVIKEGLWTGEELSDVIIFENNANFVRNNLPDIISNFNEGIISWPEPSDNTQWDYFKTASFTPGYCDFF